MKSGLATSAVLHAAILGWGLVSLSAPPPMEVVDVEALPVDIIPIESITQVQEGDREAPVARDPSTGATERQDVVENSENAGERDEDMPTPPVPNEKPKPVEATAPPPPSETLQPKQAAEPEPEPQETAALESAPATEVAAEPQPRVPLQPEPTSDDTEATPEESPVALPKKPPLPSPRPRQQTAKAQTAKTPERKIDEAAAAAEASPPSTEQEFDADKIAALLNREEAAGGGAERSEQAKSLGGTVDTGGAKLSQSELDALRGQIQRCWNPPAGVADAEGLRISIRMRLDPAGSLDGQPDLVSGGGAQGIERAAGEAALRAVIRCAPYDLPTEKYAAWQDVIVNFDPREMF